jgi:hypothetical protein
MNRIRNGVTLAILGLLALSIAGCFHTASAVESRTGSADMAAGGGKVVPLDAFITDVEHLGSVAWALCSEQDAEIVMEAEIVRLGGPLEHYSFALKRVFKYSVDGIPNPANLLPQSVITIQDGSTWIVNRLIGSGAYFLFTSSDPQAIRIEATYAWTDERKTERKAAGKVTTSVGLAEEWPLSDSVKLKVSYRMPRKSEEAQ